MRCEECHVSYWWGEQWQMKKERVFWTRGLVDDDGCVDCDFALALVDASGAGIVA